MAISKEHALEIYKSKKGSSKLQMTEDSFVRLLTNTKTCQYSSKELTRLNVSVERVNPLKGYIAGNIIFTTGKSNIAKGGTIDVFYHNKKISPDDKFDLLGLLHECVVKNSLSPKIKEIDSLRKFYGTTEITKSAKLHIISNFRGFLRQYEEKEITKMCDSFQPIQEEEEMAPTTVKSDIAKPTNEAKLHVITITDYMTLHLGKVLTGNCRITLVKNGYPVGEYVYNAHHKVALDVRNGAPLNCMDFTKANADEVIVFG